MTDKLSLDLSLLPGGTKVLCAVSGGADSMSLLHCLFSRADELGIKVAAAHFDHCLRGEESKRDRSFVEDWCAEHGVEFASASGDVAEFARNNGLGTEEAARQLRYEFLEKAADELGCDVIATAHNADDNAETLLLNLARGTGLKGLCGIPPKRGRIIRPLLKATRSEIEEYLKAHGVSHVEDSTNAGDEYTRNIIRHRVMPVLREINPAFSDAALRTSGLLRDDEEYLSSLAAEFCEKFADEMPVNELAALPKPVAARVFRLKCGRALGAVHTQQLFKLLEGEGYACVDIPGMRIARDCGRICFGVSGLALEETELKVGTETELYAINKTIIVEKFENNGQVFNSLNTLCLKYDSLCGNILLTTRKDGDKIRLRHRGCTKSLKDLFSEWGYTQSRRNLTPVIRDDKGVCAVYGFGVAERCLPESGDTVLCIKFVDNN